MQTETRSPPQLAVRAAESAQASAAAANKVAESVHAAVIEQAEWRGYVRGFMEKQTELNANFQLFLTNHLPHLQRDFGEVKGMMRVIMWAMGAIVTLIVVSGIVTPIWF